MSKNSNLSIAKYETIQKLEYLDKPKNKLANPNND